MFGQQQNKPFGFGSSSFGQNTGFGQPQTSVFGQTSTFGTPATQSGGLFGQSTSTFGAPQQPQQTQSFFGSTQPNTQTSIFGQPQQTQTQTNAFGTSAFGTQNRPSFGGFGSTATSTASTGLFGQQNTTTTGSLFGQPSTSGNVFGQSTFGAAAPSGTSVPFKATTGTDTMIKGGTTQNIQTQHQCITCMKEYENKSFEELRVDDYLANRKFGNQAQTNTFGAVSTASTGSLFGQTNTNTNTGFSFNNNNQPKPFGSGTAFGATTTQPTSTFGTQATPSPFGTTTSAANTSVFGQTNTTSSFGGFGATTAAKPTFGFGNTATPATTTQAATPFGTPKPFGTTNPTFGTATATPFGTTTSQAKPAVTFGTPSFNTSSFGNRFGTTTSTFGTPGTTNPVFNFGPTTTTQSNNIFGSKPTTTSAPFSFATPPTGTMFNSTPVTGTQPFGSFGNPSLGSTSGGFFSSSTTGLGGQTQSSNPQDEIARNRQHIMMISLPLGGDPFFKCEVKKDPIRPTSLAAQKSVLERTVKPNTPPAPKQKVIPVNRSASYASLFAGLEDSDATALGPSPKTLTIKPKMPECFNSPSIFQPATPRNTSTEADKAPEPATIVQPPVEETNSSSPPIHSTPYNPKVRMPSPLRQEMNAIPEEESSLQLAPEKSILRGGEEASPENENTIGVKCTRHGYYTKPPLNTLKLDRNGDCFVENFVIGRKDFGKMVVLGKLNVANLDIDGTVLFRRKEITVYPDESNKPPVGQGLNRKTEVTLEAVYPLNRGTRDVMKDPQQLIDSKFREKLERYTINMGATFLDYDEYTGVWVFRVNHFSRYGLLDDDDDEQAGADVAMTETRPLPSMMPPAVPPVLKEKQPRQSMEITQEMPSNYIFSPASIQVCQAMQLDNNMLQGMRASFFMDECDENDYSWTQYQPKVPSFTGIKQHEVDEKKLRMSPPHDRVQTQIALRPKKPLRVSLQMTDEFLKKFEKIPMVRPEIDHLEQNRVVNAAAGFQRIVVPAEHSLFSQYSQSFLNELATFNRARLRPSLHHWNLVRPSESVESRSLNITVPGFSKTASSICFERIDMIHAEETLEEMMSVQFANSDVTADPNTLPHYSPVRGVDLMQNHIKRLEKHDAILEVELSNTLLLCDALWGNGVSDVLDRIETEAARKRALSMWITRVTEDVVSQEVSSSDSSLQRIFSYLSGHQISAACEEAVSQSDYNLASLVAQAAHDQTTKMIVKRMYVEWTESKKDLHIDPDRLKLYAVMAGLPEWIRSDEERVNVCEGLDWLRCFALHLWYICPSNMSIAEVLADYVQATETYATPPEVKHGDRALSPLHVCFQLICLYTDRTRSIDKMLCPDTVLGVNSQLEYRHCWLLGQVLQSLQYDVPCMKELHVRMASQLESQGLWQWAVFALLHIEDPHQRQKYVYDLICRHASAAVELTESESFVQNRLQVPKEIVYKAKALRASFEQRRVNQTKLLILADELNEAHEILVNHIAVKAIINEQFGLLQDLLHKMSQNFTKIQSWNQKGRVYYNYIQLRSILKDILDTKEDEQAIERILEGKYLEGVLASLSSKLSRLPRETVEQRLCQIEMAKTTFAAYKNVLTSKSAADPHLKNSAVRAVFQLLRTLPLPEDTVAQEFRRLSEEYPEYLPRE